MNRKIQKKNNKSEKRSRNSRTKMKSFKVVRADISKRHEDVVAQQANAEPEAQPELGS